MVNFWGAGEGGGDGENKQQGISFKACLFIIVFGIQKHHKIELLAQRHRLVKGRDTFALKLRSLRE